MKVSDDDSVWAEGGYLFSLAWPASINSFLWFSMTIFNTAMVGHINTSAEYTSAAALSSMFTNVTGLSLAIGLCGGVATLAGQAHGAGNTARLGLLLQRSCVLLGVLCIPVGLLWMFSGQVLPLAGQDPLVTRLAGNYILVSTIGLLPAVGCELIESFLQCQEVVKPLVPCALVVNALNLVVCYVLVYRTPLGFLGAAAANALSNTLFFLLLLWVLWRYARPSVPRNKLCISRDALSNPCGRPWRRLVKLSLASAVMVCSEWWVFEIIGFTAGYMGDFDEQAVTDGSPNRAARTESLAAWGVLWQIIVILFCTGLGMQTAMSTRVSNLLGAGRGLHARRSTLIGCIMALILSLFLGAILFGLRAHVARVWTRDERVRVRVSGLIPLLCVFEVGDLMQGALSGVLSGMGKQGSASAVKIGGHYLISLPLSLLLGFRARWGLHGLLYGLTTGSVVVLVGNIVLLLRVDWEKQAKVAVAEAHAHCPAPAKGEQQRERRRSSGESDLLLHHRVADYSS